MLDRTVHISAKKVLTVLHILEQEDPEHSSWYDDGP